MISSVKRCIIHLMLIFLLLTIVFGKYERPYGHQRAFEKVNQRAADASFKYAWFTRDIPDEENLEQQRDYKKLFKKNIFT